jgi:cytoskeletal protein CcmA (bactofilin family)
MRKRKTGKRKKVGAISTFIGADAVIEGNVSFQGVLHMEGAVTGNIRSREGTLIIGESATVNARILVESAIIKGKVEGTVEAETSIDVSSSARITGEMYAPVIAIDPGAVFNGNCGMKKTEAAAENTLDSPEIQKSERVSG